VIGIVFAFISQQYWALGNILAAFATATAGGFLSGVVSTGSLKQGVIGAFEAGLTLGIGGSGWNTLEQIGANAVTGGVMSVLSGGKFGNGFVSAGLTCAAMPLAGNSGNVVVRSVEGALIGGTISEATGGKFVNGAISGAIQGAMEEPQQDEAKGDHPYREGDELRSLTVDETNQIHTLVDDSISANLQKLDTLINDKSTSAQDRAEYQLGRDALKMATVVYKLDQYGGEAMDMTASFIDKKLVSASLTVYRGTWDAYKSGVPSGGNYTLVIPIGHDGINLLVAHEDSHAIYGRMFTSTGSAMKADQMEPMADNWARKIWGVK
ncbi:MAG: hypothetical protein JSR74_02110, partial [Proteobacteria bacterium]|nr:hypothetical protein [Pseudomonadota bacterium]